MPETRVVVAGRYHLAYRIAAGAVGEVWRALDTVLDRPVAVKLLRAEYAEHPETLARFQAEARHAGSLSHPGIAQVYDYGGDPPFLIMEVVDGPSLAGVLTAGPLDAVRTMSVVAQVAAGLAAAHAAGLVHRDIKPANLLLCPDGQVKITDFGIAHAADSAPLTRTGTLVGTPGYLAPERAAGSAAVPASDLYSLGIVAFECLTGRMPFSGTALEVAAAHRLRPVPPLPPSVPAAVAALVRDLTAKDPAARPASAAEAASRAAHVHSQLAVDGSPSAGAAPPALGAASRGGRTAPPGGDTAALPGLPGPLPGQTRPLPGQPAPAPTAASPAQPETVAFPPLPEQPGGSPAGRGGQRAGWSWRRAGLAAAGLLMAGGLAGALLGTLSAGRVPRPQAPASRPAASTPPASAAPVVPGRRPAGHAPRGHHGHGRPDQSSRGR